MGHLVADLGWHDFGFNCSTVSQILLGHIGIRQYWHSSKQSGGTVKIIVNPTQVRDLMSLPVDMLIVGPLRPKPQKLNIESLPKKLIMFSVTWS